MFVLFFLFCVCVALTVMGPSFLFLYFFFPSLHYSYTANYVFLVTKTSHYSHDVKVQDFTSGNGLEMKLAEIWDIMRLRH